MTMLGLVISAQNSTRHMLFYRKLANSTIFAYWNSLSFEFYSMWKGVKKFTESIVLLEHTFNEVKTKKIVPSGSRASCFSCL